VPFAAGAGVSLRSFCFLGCDWGLESLLPDELDGLGRDGLEPDERDRPASTCSSPGPPWCGVTVLRIWLGPSKAMNTANAKAANVKNDRRKFLRM
jgi:hypothetical protein